MKKILLISDTHMENELFNSITKLHQDCDYFIHCGDSSLEYNNPLLFGYINVSGNHDEDSHLDIYRFLKVEDCRILITHGHLYKVYDGYDVLYEKAKQLNCNVVFHGHTHVPSYQVINGVTFINPGSVLFNRSTYGYGTYAIVTINKTCIKAHFYHHQTHELVDDIVLPDGIEMLKQFRQ